MIKVLKFSAQFCGPCRTLKPVWDELVSLVDGVEFEESDIEVSPDLASKYRIMSIPTILIIKNDKVVDTLIGLNSLETIKYAIEKHTEE